MIYGTAQLEETATVSEGKGTSVELVESYRKSSEYQSLRKTIDPLLESVREEKRKEGVGRRVAGKVFRHEVYATNFLWQVRILYSARFSRRTIFADRVS